MNAVIAAEDMTLALGASCTCHAQSERHWPAHSTPDSDLRRTEAPHSIPLRPRLQQVSLGTASHQELLEA